MSINLVDVWLRAQCALAYARAWMATKPGQTHWHLFVRHAHPPVARYTDRAGRPSDCNVVHDEERCEHGHRVSLPWVRCLPRCHR